MFKKTVWVPYLEKFKDYLNMIILFRKELLRTESTNYWTEYNDYEEGKVFVKLW